MGFGIAVSILVGLGIAVQASVLRDSTIHIHPLATSCALMIPGIISGLLWAAATGHRRDVAQVVRERWWIPIGVLGLLLVAAIAVAAARLGITTTLAISMASQLVAGAVLDARAGTASLTARAGVGVLLMIAGVVALVGGRA